MLAFFTILLIALWKVALINLSLVPFLLNVRVSLMIPAVRDCNFFFFYLFIYFYFIFLSSFRLHMHVVV